MIIIPFQWCPWVDVMVKVLLTRERIYNLFFNFPFLLSSFLIFCLRTPELLIRTLLVKSFTSPLLYCMHYRQTLQDVNSNHFVCRLLWHHQCQYLLSDHFCFLSAAKNKDTRMKNEIRHAQVSWKALTECKWAASQRTSGSACSRICISIHLNIG